MQTNRLDAHRLTHTYGQGNAAAPALADVSLTIGADGPEAVAIMGPSGSGKSTLLHVLAGIVAPADGRVVWRGQDLATMRDSQRTRLRRSDFGFVFQSGQLLPELPAIENVALPLMLGSGLRSGAEAAAGALLHRLGLGGMLHRRPGELSGGQAQRVAIARALVGNPGIVFADEPTGALDRATGTAVMALLIGATLGHGASLVVVTHDPEVAAACSRVIRLEDGHVVSDGPADGVTDASAHAGAPVQDGAAQEGAAQEHDAALAALRHGEGLRPAPAQGPEWAQEPEHAGRDRGAVAQTLQPSPSAPARWAAAPLPAHPAVYGAPSYAVPSSQAVPVVPHSAPVPVVQQRASAPVMPPQGSYGEQRVANPMQQWLEQRGAGTDAFGGAR